MLYGFTSTTENNGSAFAGLGGNTYFNILMGVVMLCGRFLFLIPAVLLAGSLAGKPRTPETTGTFQTHSPIFVGLLARRHHHRRRADVLPGRRARPDRRTSPNAARKELLMISERRLERRPKARSLFDRAILSRALVDSFRKLDPRWQFRNPVMFVCEIGALVTLGFFFRDLRVHGPAGFDFAISIWLWFTVLFANFAEAVAEGRGKAQADFLRRTKTDTKARRMVARPRGDWSARPSCAKAMSSASTPASSSPPTATSSRAPRPSTNPPSPANPHRSSAKRAATAAR